MVLGQLDIHMQTNDVGSILLDPSYPMMWYILTLEYYSAIKNQRSSDTHHNVDDPKNTLC